MDLGKDSEYPRLLNKDIKSLDEYLIRMNESTVNNLTLLRIKENYLDHIQ